MTSPEYRECPNCSARVPSGMKYCPNCGVRLKEARPKTKELRPTTEMPAGPAPARSTVPKVPQALPQATEPQPQQLKCPNCGTDVRPGEKYCTSCGFNIEVWQKRRAFPPGGISYYTTRKRFFSFEGYSLEGVTPAATMYLIWGLWNFVLAGLAYMGQVQIFYPSPLDSGAMIVLIILGLSLFLAAFGLMQVNPTLYLLGLIALIVSVPLSISQISYSMNAEFVPTPSGTHQLENLLTGLLGILTSFAGLIQTLRVRKYFFPSEE